MVKPFQISVTIPVYNAANYVEQAVESALIQPQTEEVILVEDASSDNSLAVCQKLVAENKKVHLFQHPDGRNHGCSASRSLAVQRSTCEYIAFLDADDFYLPGRFTTAEQMFSNDPELAGVYEAIGMHVENETSLQRWKDAKRALTPLTTMTKRVSAEELFTKMVLGGVGTISIDGLVVKRSLFEKTGYFDESLPLHMDDVFFIKAAALTKLAPGKLDEPVAMRRVHENNRISSPRSNLVVYKMRLIYWSTLWNWSRQHVDREKQQQILKAMLKDAARVTRFNWQSPGHLSGFQKGVQLLMLPFEYPFVVMQSTFWRAFLQLIPPIK